MMRDLHLDDVELVVAPTVRDDDGLAKSSRNAYLSAAQRHAALAISRGLRAGEARASAGEISGPVLVAAVREIIAQEPACELEYVSLVDADEFTPVSKVTGSCILCVAARVGSTRLIDNVLI
jgi:pantoate--beta-alanine ligase